jgi:hypothetical protein
MHTGTFVVVATASDWMSQYWLLACPASLSSHALLPAQQ